jgi:hypothetical protein
MSTPCPYVLLVIANVAEKTFSVVDPKEQYKVIFKASDYDAVKMWLLEDEYTRVDGRMVREE